MELRYVRTPVLLGLAMAAVFFTAGCATSDGDTGRPDVPSVAGPSEPAASTPYPREDAPEDHPESSHEAQPVESGGEETARIASPEFPETVGKAGVEPERTFPQPDPPGPPILGIPAETWRAAAEDFREHLSMAARGYADRGAVFTFEGGNVPEEKKTATEGAGNTETSSSSRDISAVPAEGTGETPEPPPERYGTGDQSSAGGRTGAPVSSGPGEAGDGAPVIAPPAENSPSETLYGMPGDTLGVTLDGRGWIFTGMGEGSSPGNLSFVSRSNTPQYTDFIFMAEGLGAYTLNFQKQDFSSGTFETKKVAVHIVGAEEFARIVAGMKSGSGGPAGSTGEPYSGENLEARRTAARRLLRLGRREEALDIYMGLDRPDDPEILDITAELAFDLGRYDAARDAWTRNLAAEGGFRDRALIGLTDIALDRGDTAALGEYAPELLGITGISTERQLFRTGFFYAEESRYGSAITFLEAYLERYFSGNDADRVYYLLGTVYEKNTEFRNIERARSCYRAVLDDYPASIYWERARERLRYLERHFFSVR